MASESVHILCSANRWANCMDVGQGGVIDPARFLPSFLPSFLACPLALSSTSIPWTDDLKCNTYATRRGGKTPDRSIAPTRHTALPPSLPPCFQTLINATPQGEKHIYTPAPEPAPPPPPPLFLVSRASDGGSMDCLSPYLRDPKPGTSFRV